MTYSVFLFAMDALVAPTWWNNTLDHCDEIDRDHDEFLTEYKAQFRVNSEGTCYLDFEDESYFSLMLLRWS